MADNSIINILKINFSSLSLSQKVRIKELGRPTPELNLHQPDTGVVVHFLKKMFSSISYHGSVLRGAIRPITPGLINTFFENIATNMNGTSSSHTALIFEDNDKMKKYTYAELDGISNRLSRVILKIILEKDLEGNSDGDYIIGVCIQPSDYLVITLLAILKAGCAYLPFDHNSPKVYIDHMLNEAKPVMVIYDEDIKEKLGNTFHLDVKELFSISDKFESSSLSNQERYLHIKNDVAVVLHTSGSTGIPKGARLLHRGIINRLEWQFKTFPWSQTETTSILKTTVTFIDATIEIFGSLLSGLTLLIIPKKTVQNPEQFVAILEKYKIERLMLVPSLLSSILTYIELQGKKDVLPNLKMWMCTGEPLTATLTERFYKVLAYERNKLYNFYGSTEVSDVTFHLALPDVTQSYDQVPIGLPVDNTIIYLLDSDLRPVSSGEIGELFVSGLSLLSGYVNERFPDTLVDNPFSAEPTFTKLYRSGDLARIENGILVNVGRTDSQIKVRGQRVNLLAIEKVVLSIPHVLKAVVLCSKPGEVNQVILAFITTEPQFTTNQATDILKQILASFMIPQLVLTDRIPLVVNGKTDRLALLNSYEDSTLNNMHENLDYSGISPSAMAAARVLFETVASMLNASVKGIISTKSNFYEIGGNSLNTICTISSLHAQGYPINIDDFINAPNLGTILNEMISVPTRIQHPLSGYKIEMLEESHKLDVQKLVAEGFVQKGDLDNLVPDVSESDYFITINQIWQNLVQNQLSFVVMNGDGKTIGVTINYDGEDKPKMDIHSSLLYIYEFAYSVELLAKKTELVRPHQGLGKIMNCFVMATHAMLTPAENIRVVRVMEEELIRLGTSKKFVGILTTNTNRLTQDLATDIYGYKVCVDYQVNQYVANDNTKPFGEAPDSQRALAQWKALYQ